MKKGFTLIELLVVIFLIGLVSLIIVSTVTNVLDSSRENLNKKQKEMLIKAADRWALDNLSPLTNEEAKIELTDLIKGGYIENSAIKDPKTEEYLVGCILAKYNNNQYEFKFSNKPCN